jgi:hypothetical protein
VVPKALTDLEYGRCRPTDGTMRQISAALGLDPLQITEFAAVMTHRRSMTDEPPTT